MELILIYLSDVSQVKNDGVTVPGCSLETHFKIIWDLEFIGINLAMNIWDLGLAVTKSSLGLVYRNELSMGIMFIKF